jgi:branched-chain amino acid transport system permease protein
VLIPQAAGVTVYVLMAAILLWRPEGLFRRV